MWFILVFVFATFGLAAVDLSKAPGTLPLTSKCGTLLMWRRLQYRRCRQDQYEAYWETELAGTALNAYGKDIKELDLLVEFETSKR